MISATISAAPLVGALKATGRQAQAAANNIANASTPDYQAERGRIVSQGTGNGASYVALQAGGGVDLGTELISLRTASLAYRAAAESFASVLRTEDRVLNTLA